MTSLVFAHVCIGFFSVFMTLICILLVVVDMNHGSVDMNPGIGVVVMIHGSGAVDINPGCGIVS